MKIAIVFILALTLTLTLTLAPMGRAQTPTTPDLGDTVDFMNRMAEAPNRKVLQSIYVIGAPIVGQRKECSITWIGSSEDRRIAMPVKKYVKSTDAYGVNHYGYKWNVVNVNDEFALFSLADIDPSSVNSGPTFSLSGALGSDQAWEENHSLKINDRADRTMIMFKTRDVQKVIYSSDEAAIAAENNRRAYEAGQAVKNDGTGSALLFTVFQSKDNAERFVTALKHAVALCGGAASDFAPTPGH